MEMNISGKQYYSKYLNHISKYLINNKVSSLNSLTWNTQVSEYDITKYYHQNCTLVNDNIGVLLLLLDVYKINNDQEIFNIISESIKIISEGNQYKIENTLGLFTGSGGLVYLLLQMYNATNNGEYLDNAVILVKNNVDSFLSSPFTSNVLNDGRAGLIIILMHLYKFTNQDWIIEKIITCVNSIIVDFSLTSNGICWNNNDWNTRPLLGLLNGSAGISLVFIKLADFFENKIYFEIAKSLFKYEDFLIRNSKCLFPDFEKEIKTGKDYLLYREYIANGNLNYFTTSVDDLTFEKGALGFSLVRYYAYKYSNNHEYLHFLKQLETLLLYSDNFKKLHYSDIEILMLFEETDNCSLFFDKVIQILAKKVDDENNKIADLSLNTDIQCISMILRSILRDCNGGLAEIFSTPKFSKSQFGWQDNSTLNEKLLSCNFPLTLDSIKYYSESTYNIIVHNFNITTGIDYFQNFILSLESNSITDFINDIFEFEYRIKDFQDNLNDKSMLKYIQIMSYRDILRLINLTDNELCNEKVILSDCLLLLTSNYDFSEWYNNINKQFNIKEFIETKESEINLLIFSDSENTKKSIEKADDMGNLTYKIFKKSRIIKDALELYYQAFEIENENDTAQIKAIALQYIRNFIRKKYIVKHN